jgi:hypothetical protein
MNINGIVIPGGIEGSSYIYVKGDSDPVSNVIELINAYNTAKSATPYGNALSDSNRFTVIVGAGTYTTHNHTPITFDTSFVNVVSLTGNADVLITWGLSIESPEHCDFVGLNCGNQAFTIVNGIQVNYLKFTNCKGGDKSFGSSISGTVVEINNSYFLNCSTIDSGNGDNSFGGAITGNTYENCKSGTYSFGCMQDSGNDYSIENNTFINCTANGYSFLYYTNNGSIYINYNTFINCTSTTSSFISLNGNVIVNVEENVFRGCTVTEFIDGRNFISCTSAQVQFNQQNIIANRFYDCESKDTESFIYCDLTMPLIENNYFYNCSNRNDSAFITIKYNYDQGQPESIQINRNTISNCNSGRNSFCYIITDINGIGAGDSQMIISNNIINNCFSNGGTSFLFIETGASWLHRIANNKVNNCQSQKGQQVFIVSVNAKECEIQENVIDGCHSESAQSYLVVNTQTNKGINISDNLISNSVATNNYSFCNLNLSADMNPKLSNTVFKDCRSTADFCFGYIESTSSKNLNDVIFMNCIATNYSFGCTTIPITITFRATAVNCVAESECFGNTAIVSGRVNYCNLLSGTFNYSSGNQVRLCIDGNQDEINS